MILNGVLTPIPCLFLLSTVLCPSHSFFLASLPLPHFHSLPYALSLPPFPSNSKNPQITKPYLSTTTLPSFFHYFRLIALPSTMALRVGSKCKGKKPIHEDSPPWFDHSTYPYQEAFDRYSTRTITYGRVVHFEHLGFMSFNQIMRRM